MLSLIREVLVHMVCLVKIRGVMVYLLQSRVWRDPARTAGTVQNERTRIWEYGQLKEWAWFLVSRRLTKKMGMV